MRMNLVIGLVAIPLLLSIGSLKVANAQPDDLRQVFRQIGRQIAGAADGSTVDETAPADDEPLAELPRTQIEIKPNEIRFHLLDGSVVTGELAVTELIVTTDFGQLTVPVSRIQSLRPGLDSYPELSAELSQLVTDLADEAYEVREEAQKKLINYGLPIKKYVSDRPG